MLDIKGINNLKMPEHSKLYCIEPVGIGTLLTESLTGCFIFCLFVFSTCCFLKRSSNALTYTKSFCAYFFYLFQRIAKFSIFNGLGGKWTFYKS